MAVYKLQVQDDEGRPEHWRDVPSPNGAPLLFDDQAKARACLADMFPVLTKMEAFGVDRKRTRVVVVNPYQQDDDEKED